VPSVMPTQIPCRISSTFHYIYIVSEYPDVNVDNQTEFCLLILTYHCIHLELEPKEGCQRDADDVVAADVDKRHERLPPCPDRHAREHGLDAVEEDGAGEEVAQPGGLPQHVLVLAEEARQPGPPGHEHGEEDGADGARRQHRHDHRELGRLGPVRAQLVRHPHAATEHAVWASDLKQSSAELNGARVASRVLVVINYLTAALNPSATIRVQSW
jgi:hypothetical protein